MKLELPYGRMPLVVEIDGRTRVLELPRIPPATESVAAMIARALEQPIGAPPLSALSPKRATVIVHPDNNTIFGEIVAGRADLMITDAIETRYQAMLHPELCAVHPEKPFDHAEKAYFMPKDEDLKRAVDRWLEEAKRSGAFRRAMKKWVG